MQNYCYKQDLLREFIHEETMNSETAMTAHGFRYMLKCFQHLRNHESHKPSKIRLDRDRCFEAMVDNLLSTCHSASQAQQTQPTVVYDPPDGDIPTQWEENGLDDPLSLGIDIGLYTGQIPYPTFPVYASHLGGNGTQMPAPTMHPSSSEDPTQQYAADPHNAPTAFPYHGAMPPQSGSPCSAAGGSAHRSSGPSSQSRDSGDLTLETQNTQYTQQDAALLHHCCRAVEEGGPPCDHHGAAPCSSCSCSTSPGGMMPGHGPGRHAGTSPGHQGSSEHNLYGVGTSSFARPEFQDGSNSDEDLGPIPDIWKK